MARPKAEQRPIWQVLPPIGARVRLRASSPWCSAHHPIPADTAGEVAGWYGDPLDGGDHEARYRDFPLFDGHPPPEGKPGRLCQPGELTVVKA
jgi:hypothetical protein